MSENIAIPNDTPGTPPSGDPSLGPNDVFLEIKFLLLGKEEILSQEDVSMRLSNALTPAGQDSVAKAIQSSAELMLQSAITQTSEAILRRYPPSKQKPSGDVHRQEDLPLPNATLGLASAPSGDPTLGPNDARLKIKLLLMGQKEILCQDEAAARLPNALTPAARGAAAAAIETSTELMVKNTLAKIDQTIEKRFPRSEPEKIERGYNSTFPPIRKDNYPERLPERPAKKTNGLKAE